MSLVLSDRKVGYFNSYIIQRIERNKNFIFAITGQTGSGKSYSALSIGETLDSDFDQDNICFSATQFMDLVQGKIKKLKKGSVIMFDEIQISLGHMDYQSLQAKLMNYVLSTFRHKCFVLIVTTPYFSFINASARKLFHSRAETLAINQDKKQVILKPFLLQTNQDTGNTYRKYLRIHKKGEGVAPLTRVKVGMASKRIIELYEQKKTEFTTKLNQSISKDLARLEGKEEPKPLTEKQEQVIKILQQGKTIPQVSKELGISERSLYQHIELIKKKGVSFKPVYENSKVICYEVLGYEG